MGMPPLLPHDPKFWETEAKYKPEQAKRGGILSDLLVSLVELIRLTIRVAIAPPRLVARLWLRRRQRNSAR